MKIKNILLILILVLVPLFLNAQDEMLKNDSVMVNVSSPEGETTEVVKKDKDTVESQIEKINPEYSNVTFFMILDKPIENESSSLQSFLSGYDGIKIGFLYKRYEIVNIGYNGIRALFDRLGISNTETEDSVNEELPGRSEETDFALSPDDFEFMEGASPDETEDDDEVVERDTEEPRLTEYQLDIMKEKYLTALKLLSYHLETRCLIIITDYKEEWETLISDSTYQAYRNDEYPVIEIVGSLEEAKEKVDPLVNKVLTTYKDTESGMRQPVEARNVFLARSKPLYKPSADIPIKNEDLREFVPATYSAEPLPTPEVKERPRPKPRPKPKPKPKPRPKPKKKPKPKPKPKPMNKKEVPKVDVGIDYIDDVIDDIDEDLENIDSVEIPKREPVITRAELTGQSNIKPPYPPAAREFGLEGDVKIGVFVSDKGIPTKVIVLQSSGHDVLDKAAVNGAKKWRFKPATRDGVPQKDYIEKIISFRLDD